MAVNMQDKKVLVFYEDGFQLVVPSHYRENIENIQFFFFLSTNLWLSARHNSSALVMELHLSCTNPLKYMFMFPTIKYMFMFTTNKIYVYVSYNKICLFPITTTEKKYMYMFPTMNSAGKRCYSVLLKLHDQQARSELHNITNISCHNPPAICDNLSGSRELWWRA